MATVLQSILMVFAGISIEYGIKALREWNKSRHDNRLFCVLTFSSAWWSVCFGLLLVQKSEENAYICRCLGLIGTFAYLIAAVLLFIIWADIPRRIAVFLKSFVFMAMILYPFICRRSAIEFYATSFGYSYVTENDIWNVLYNVYSLGMAAIMLYMIIRMMNRRNKRRIRSLGYVMLGVLLCIGMGGILDTLLPMLGFPAIPGSTITQFFGTVIVYYALKYMDRMGQTIEGVGYQLFHTLKIPIMIYTDNHKLILMSDEAKQSMKLESKLGTFTQPDDIFLLDANPLDTVDEFATYPTKLRSNGQDCELEVGVLKDNYGDVSGYCVIAYDTSERMKFIEQLETERARADKANIAKTAFLANMSHEIRTPINTVLGMNEMIRRESDSNVVKGYSANIKNSGEALLSIINDILDFSKVEAGMMEIVESEYNLRDMLIRLIEMFSLKSSEKGLEFKTEIENDLPMILHGDEIRIRQVMMNLLSNAVKYTGNGSVTFIVRRVRTLDGSFRIHFAVRDTGIGIREKDRETLFDSFTRFENKRTKYIEGTGLGLSIVRKLAELMDAKLMVDSVYGQGSTFSFELNQDIVDATPIGDVSNLELFAGAQEEGYRESFTAPSASILVVDDNKMNREVIKGLLKKTLVRIDTADSGNACLEKAVDTKYDIILLDHMMPGMDGIETLKMFKAIPESDNASCGAKVVVLTANAIYGAREMYLTSGFDDYLSKPVESGKLEALIRKYLPAEKLEPAVEPERQDERAADDSNGDNTSEAGKSGDCRDSNYIKILETYGISCEKALEYCGSMELFAITAQTFVDTSEETVQKLKEFRDNNAVDDYRILIHAVKSNARTLGCESLFEYALSQENLCKEKNFMPVLADYDKPEECIRYLCEGLIKGLGLNGNLENMSTLYSSDMTDSDQNGGEASDGLPDEASKEQIAESLNQAIISLEDFDAEAAEAAFAGLLEMKPGKGIYDEINSALTKCRNYDYEGARILAADVLKNISR